LKYLE